MKKFILLATSVSFLCAGPMVTPLVDYDKADEIEAETKVEQKLVLPLAQPPVVTTPGIRKKSFKYEADVLAGRNWTDDDSVLKDATTLGIRFNRFITDDVAIQIGYDRIFDAKYKFSKKTRSFRNNTGQSGTTTNCPEGYCCTCTPCPPEDGNTNGNYGDTGTGDENTGDPSNNSGMQDDNSGNENNQGAINDPSDGDNSTEQSGSNNADGNGNYNGNSNNGSSGSGNSIKPGGNNTTTPSITTQGHYNATRSTDVDRFYINALKEIHSESTRLIPFFFAGLGYEHVNDKNLGIDSQGFFNAGGGLKYRLGEKFRLISEAKAIKKFKDNDLDIVAMLGLGMLFGQTEESPASEAPVSNTIEPKPQQQDLSLVLLDEASTPNSAIDTSTSAPSVETIIEEDNKIPAVPTSAPAIDDHAYYIQVAVVTSEQGKQNYLRRLRASGLPHTTKTIQVNHKTGYRILVGPYLSRSEAVEDLRQVTQIEKGAFIKQL